MSEKTGHNEKGFNLRNEMAMRLAALGLVAGASVIGAESDSVKQGLEDVKSSVTATANEISGKLNQETLMEMESANLKEFRVVEWGKESDSPDSVATFAGLRAKAGWSLTEEEEFKKVIAEKYPDCFNSETLIIQPGTYEVPTKN